jgi:phytoene/squalene synthetase
MNANNQTYADLLSHIDFEKITKNPNILIAAGFWDKERYEAAKVCYKFMRMIDDLVDDHKVDHKTFTDCEKTAYAEKVNDWIECLQSNSDGAKGLEDMVHTIRKFRIPLYLFHDFARAMIYDINHDGFPTFNAFLNYSEGAAVAPASIFVHLACLNEDLTGYRVPFMDLKSFARPCALFSYIVHIIRDFQKDTHENLNYFAIDMLKENGLTPEDLRKIADGDKVPDSFRRMIKQYCDYALIYKNQTEAIILELSKWLPEKYMLSLRLIYQLYLNVFDRIDIQNSTFSHTELNPAMDEIKDQVTELVTYYNHQAI